MRRLVDVTLTPGGVRNHAVCDFSPLAFGESFIGLADEEASMEEYCYA